MSLNFQPLPETIHMLAIGSTIGILGGGQLGRMMSMAASRLGYHVHIYSDEAEAPAAEVSRQVTLADYTDETALRKFASEVDCVTLEFENIPVTSLRLLQSLVAVMPGPQVLDVTQHRLREKEFIAQQAIATAPFHPVMSLQDLREGLAMLGTPAILKTACMGYDGKGQFLITNAVQAEEAWQALGEQPCVLEGFVEFTAELSIIVARNRVGEMTVFPLTRNVHQHHILHESYYPAQVEPEVALQAQEIAQTLAIKCDLIGLLAVELFLCENNQLIVNELAPRPHNSGHWTMDACATSQFEQAIRAVA
ncbi:MAG: 5-(carboxyamino)imidazole ribonucleotide synthase, partial [Rickettsiales bacterium]|nr:5-(carboxyamino)imidazole ribonucleotide synthase [Rickettsiales bacterium]